MNGSAGRKAGAPVPDFSATRIDLMTIGDSGASVRGSVMIAPIF